MNKKEIAYKQNIHRSLIEMYQWMQDHHLSWLPEDAEFDMDTLTDEQLASCEAVEAIEQEWIVDPEQRAQLSLLGYTDEERQ